MTIDAVPAVPSARMPIAVDPSPASVKLLPQTPPSEQTRPGPVRVAVTDSAV